jgi:hypothetical protein
MTIIITTVAIAVLCSILAVGVTSANDDPTDSATRNTTTAPSPRGNASAAPTFTPTFTRPTPSQTTTNTSFTFAPAAMAAAADGYGARAPAAGRNVQAPAPSPVGRNAAQPLATPSARAGTGVRGLAGVDDDESRTLADMMATQTQHQQLQGSTSATCFASAATPRTCSQSVAISL